MASRRRMVLLSRSIATTLRRNPCMIACKSPQFISATSFSASNAAVVVVAFPVSERSVVVVAVSVVFPAKFWVSILLISSFLLLSASFPIKSASTIVVVSEGPFTIDAPTETDDPASFRRFRDDDEDDDAGDDDAGTGAIIEEVRMSNSRIASNNNGTIST